MTGRDSIYTETEVTYEDGRKGTISATLRWRCRRGGRCEQRMAAR